MKMLALGNFKSGFSEDKKDGEEGASPKKK